MSLTGSQISFNTQWTQAKDQSPFEDTTQSDSVALAVVPDTSVMNRVFLGSATLAANANTTFDLYSFTDLVGNVTTATKARGLAITATGSGGIMKLEPGASNPATWFLSGTTPAISLNCGTDGTGICLYDGSSFTLSATIRNMKVSNTGNASIDVKFYALLGT
jgi:hypothetical protein